MPSRIDRKIKKINDAINTLTDLEKDIHMPSAIRGALFELREIKDELSAKADHNEGVNATDKACAHYLARLEEGRPRYKDIYKEIAANIYGVTVKSIDNRLSERKAARSKQPKLSQKRT